MDLLFLVMKRLTAYYIPKLFLYAGLRKPLVFLSLLDHCECVYNDIYWVVGGKRYHVFNAIGSNSFVFTLMKYNCEIGHFQSPKFREIAHKAIQ